MRTYENLLMAVDEWVITSTIELDDDGRFRYYETWGCYAGSVNSKAEGTWRRTESAVVLETEHIEGSTFLNLEKGREFKALDRGDCLDFGNEFIMRAGND